MSTEEQLDAMHGEPPRALVRVLGAARVLDELFTGEPNYWRLDGRLLTENAASAMLSLHDYLNDAEAEGERRERARRREGWSLGWPDDSTTRYRILDELWLRFRNGRHGATREELAKTLRVSENTIRPRVVELIRGGWIGAAAVVESEDARFADPVRRTRCKQDASVLVLTAATIDRMTP